jgi:hypothetical protein
VFRAELELLLEIEPQVVLVEWENADAAVHGLAVDNLEARIRIMNAYIAIFPPGRVLMRVFVALRKIKLTNDVRIRDDEEGALGVQVQPGHFAPGAELAVKPLDKDNVVIVDLANASQGLFARSIHWWRVPDVTGSQKNAHSRGFAVHLYTAVRLPPTA